MTDYGTIPTSTPSQSNSDLSLLGFISRAKERGSAALASRRPWREMATRDAFSLPQSLHDARSRVATNLTYFAGNYTIVALLILFFSLLFHPISLIVFVVLMAAWLFLYLLRDGPLFILGKEVGDKVILIVLAVLTLGLLLLTGATENIVWDVLIAVVVVLVHAVMRKTDDLFLDDRVGEEEADPSGGRYKAVG